MVIYTRVAFLPAFMVFSAVFLGVPLALGRVEWNGPVPVWIGIMALTQATEDAVLSPGVAGGLSPALRVVAGLRLLAEIA